MLLVATAASAAHPSAPVHASPNATLQSRGSNPAQTIPLALSLPKRDLNDTVTFPENPAQRRACLERHRLFPLLCKTDRPSHEMAASPPPPLVGECSAQGGHEAVCHYGRGRCLYDEKRGWFCACDIAPSARRPRGLHLRASAADHAMAPDCIDIGDIESRSQNPIGIA